jgi:hypothetical protein
MTETAGIRVRSKAKQCFKKKKSKSRNEAKEDTCEAEEAGKGEGVEEARPALE